MNPNDLKQAKERIGNPKWRLNNLYWIVDKEGAKIQFKMNWAQEELYDNLWYCTIVLKARACALSQSEGGHKP